MRASARECTLVRACTHASARECARVRACARVRERTCECARVECAGARVHAVVKTNYLTMFCLAKKQNVS